MERETQEGNCGIVGRMTVGAARERLQRKVNQSSRIRENLENSRKYSTKFFRGVQGVLG